jgi:hypothetical protein
MERARMEQEQMKRMRTEELVRAQEAAQQIVSSEEEEERRRQRAEEARLRKEKAEEKKRRLKETIANNDDTERAERERNIRGGDPLEYNDGDADLEPYLK